VTRALLTAGSGDVDRLRAALRQAAAIGGDVAWLGGLIGARLADLPDERLRRRDQAFIDLAAYCTAPSARRVAQETARRIRRYAASRWGREQLRPSAPLLHGPEGAALFQIMRIGGPIGFEAIRKILADARNSDTYMGISTPVEITQIANQPRIEPMKDEPVNFAIRKDDLDGLTALARQPSTLKLIETDKARVVAERQARVDRIAALDAKAEKEWPASQKVIASKIAGVRAAEVALRARQPSTGRGQPRVLRGGCDLYAPAAGRRGRPDRRRRYCADRGLAGRMPRRAKSAEQSRKPHLGCEWWCKVEILWKAQETNPTMN
jgi:hypothetical protein